MSPIPRVARVPHASKDPDAVPALRQPRADAPRDAQEKLEIVQLWRCSSANASSHLVPRHCTRSAPTAHILSALTDYDIGYSLEQTAA
jgi:hypothetical protein